MNCTSTLYTIVAGEDKEIDILLKYADSEKPFNLSSASSIKAKFLKADNTILEKTLLNGITIISAEGGMLKIRLEDTDTSLLKTGEEMSFELEIVIGSDTTIVQFEKVFSIKQRLFV